MKTSESILKIAPALAAAQKNFLSAKKNNANSHFKNKYADLQSVIEAVKDSLCEHGISFIQSPTEAVNPTDGDFSLRLTTTLLHTSGEWIADTAVCPLVKRDPQAFGAAVTYLRRYCLSAMLGIYQADSDAEEAMDRGGVENEPFDLSSAIESIEGSTTMELLQANYFPLANVFKKNKQASLRRAAAKDKRKGELA